MLSSLPCFYAFWWSAIPTSRYIFNVFLFLFMSLFISSRCMLELKFAIYCRAASLPSQASCAEESLTRPGFLQHSPHTNCTAILRNDYISLLSDLCACVHVKKWHRKGSHSSSVSGSNRLHTWKKAMGWCTTQWKMLLFCAKTIVKESRKFELAHLKKKKKKEKHFGRLATFWFGTFAMLFSTTGCVFHHENTRRWAVGC